MLSDMFGQYRIEDALTDEVMAIAYSFNAQQPRFYTKFNSVNNPKIYNLTMADAVGASSSLPIYFEPKVLVNGLN
jgi:patatin-like phospholipase/acyl hydrolase